MNFIYPRPKVFSNPDKDFTPEELGAILQKPDADNRQSAAGKPRPGFDFSAGECILPGDRWGKL